MSFNSFLLHRLNPFEKRCIDKGRGSRRHCLMNWLMWDLQIGIQCALCNCSFGREETVAGTWRPERISPMTKRGQEEGSRKIAASYSAAVIFWHMYIIWMKIIDSMD
jgi:hypothetical protein